MATDSVVFLCGCVVLLLAVQDCSAIKCYSCNVGGCGDQFDSNSWAVTTVECETGSCTKYKDGDIVSRHCTESLEKEDCDESGDTAHCLCTTDFCNGGSIATYSMAAMLSLVLVVAVMARM